MKEAILIEVLMKEDDRDFDKLYDMLFKSERSAKVRHYKVKWIKQE